MAATPKIVADRPVGPEPASTWVRTTGTIRARAKIGLQNLVYNIRRLATLERMAAA